MYHNYDFKHIVKIFLVHYLRILFIHSFIHFIFHISIYRLNTKGVEIVIVVVTKSGKVTNVRCFNTSIIQWSHSN